MDRIEATEKATAILGDNYQGMTETHHYDFGYTNDHDYAVFSKKSMPRGSRCATGHSWESMIEDLENSMRSER